MFHPDFVFYPRIDSPRPGAAGSIDAEKKHVDAFPAIHLKVLDTVAEGDKADAYIVVEGDQGGGDYFGIPARGAHVRFSMRPPYGLLLARDARTPGPAGPADQAPGFEPAEPVGDGAGAGEADPRPDLPDRGPAPVLGEPRPDHRATYRALAAPRPRPATQLCRLTGGDRRVEAA